MANHYDFQYSHSKVVTNKEHIPRINFQKKLYSIFLGLGFCQNLVLVYSRKMRINSVINETPGSTLLLIDD